MGIFEVSLGNPQIDRAIRVLFPVCLFVIFVQIYFLLAVGVAGAALMVMVL